MLLGALVVFMALTGLVLQRQAETQHEVERVSHSAMQEVADENLQQRGENMVEPLAELLVNPLYYHDLDSMGVLLQGALKQRWIRYVYVFDAQGRVLHDGSESIPAYGLPMDDPLAPAALAATALRTQFSDSIMDVSAPIMIGRERLGGVRIGYDLGAMRVLQERATHQLGVRLKVLAERQMLWLLVLGVALMAMGAAVLWTIQRWLVMPIRNLADAARKIESGHYDVLPLDSKRNDELGELIRAFRNMGRSVARHDRDIRKMAYTDALTGQANRLAFREALDERLLRLSGSGRQLALLFADIDDFKRVNDTLGHDVGDEVLLEVSRRIRDVVQRLGGPGAMLARFGGDEFVILVEAADPRVNVREIATTLGESLVEELGAPLALREREVFLGISIGISMYPDDALTAAMLMKNGDIAMYQAKLAGKNCARYYDNVMNSAVERHVRLETELRGAWERGELSVVYQPVIRVADDAVVGAEALLRWHHPELGEVPPAVFIDVAEKTGLIELLGPKVMTAACRDAARWPPLDGGPPPFVTVNVSARELRSSDLPRSVARSLDYSGLDPGRLLVELTETAMIGDEAHAGRVLQQLRATGVQVWLDDFGTGFSGLSHLRRVPVDGVKIDRSFVADILHDPDDLALTTAIIAMARSLGITVIAEGVENRAQYQLLRDRGCDLAQGFSLANPMSSDEFVALCNDAAAVHLPG
ncbi:EAL domain-containing protein [Lysobacter ciconiae]|uniref:EAL domain-containing protein n=1 Tax=Novilysobacter ciconiae TaxID=2781022 RepID=A0A7S6UIE4_9GAMM|nr:EAL domain-containing protein [Lysobacter ciconiae]QOW20790.1 EAL domain-containing protein [Lysobacter ciconiae]